MTLFSVIIFLLALILALVGIIGAIVPALPGPPLSFGALFIAFLTTGQISGTTLFILFLFTLVVSILDYIAPIWFTKLGGGSKAATWGATLGMVAGLFFMPIGLIAGPLLGAFVGEYTHNNNAGHAFKVAAWSFLSFLTTTGLKLICSLILTYYTLAAYFN